MALALELEPASGLECLSNLICGREGVFGAVDCDNRHPVPQKSRVAWPEAVGQFNGFRQDVPKNRPGDLATCSGEAASVHRIGLGPKAAAPCGREKGTCLGVHSAAFPTGGKGEDEGNELCERQLPLARKIPRGFFEIGVQFFWNEVKKRSHNLSDLA